MSEFLSTIDYVGYVYTLFLLVVGWLCNPLSFYVFSRPAFRTSTSSLYFRFLSVVDLGTLTFNISLLFRHSSFALIDEPDLLTCRILYWLGMLFMYCSSWTLVLVSLDRAVSVIIPLKAQIFCNLKRAKLAILLIILGNCCLSCPLLYLLQNLKIYIPELNTTRTVECWITDQQALTIYALFEFCLFAIIPGCIVVICSIIIVTGIAQSRKRVQKMLTNSDPVSTSIKPVEKSKISQDPGSAAQTDGHPSKSVQGDNVQRQRRENTLRITLILVNSTFLICNLPLVIYQISPYFTSLGYGSEETAKGIYRILVSLTYTNNALNFLLYCIAGSKFRSEAKLAIMAVFNCICLRGRT